MLFLNRNRSAIEGETMDPALTTGVPPADAFVHVRIIIGIILGLSVSRLLTGVARFIQHPGKQNIYPVHIAWVAFSFSQSSISGGLNSVCEISTSGLSKFTSLSSFMRGFTSCYAHCCFQTIWGSTLVIAITLFRVESGFSAFWLCFTSLILWIRFSRG